MLKFEDFQPVDKSIIAFKFQQLTYISSSAAVNPVYCDDKENKYSFVHFDAIEELRTIDLLARTGIILNYKGGLQKEGRLFGFYSLQEFTTLDAYGHKIMDNNERPDERFCIQFFQSFILILLEVQKQGQFLKIITPFGIGIRNPDSQANVGFGLLLPFSCRFLNYILRQQYEQNIKYVAPEIIRHFNHNPAEQVCQKQFRKASLYSVGLSLLYCFGYIFTSKQRIEASKNDKQFRNNFKKIRRQIKVLHNGKFVPKALKLLLQDCQKSRQIIETFCIKLKSAQFDNLRVCKNASISEYKFFSTISDSNKSQISKSQKTINMEINENTSPLNLTPISNLRHSQKSRKGEQINSPINIEISYGDEAAQSIWLSKTHQQKIIEQEMLQKQDSQPQTKQQTSKQEIEKVKDLGGLEQMEVYQYHDANLMKIGDNNPRKLELNHESVFLDEAQSEEQRYFDEKSLLRRRFENEAKVIMGAILFSFFLYGVAGYLRQNT